MPNPETQPRRSFLKAAALAASATPLASSSPKVYAISPVRPQSATPRKRVGSIGTGSRWNAVGRNAMQFGDIVAVCDVDARHRERAANVVQERQGKNPDAYADYADLLKRDDIEVVTIVTPDHWHTKIAIEAMRAGKDVYCEKPLTLTIEEGKQIIQVLEETGRVFQVGTQQRSEFGQRFLQAIALCQAGRLGNISKVTCTIGGAPTSNPLPVVAPPEELDWERWQGQAPLADYRFQETSGRRPATRCHYEFRWWYEYSGGKMTDWGAHHVDIAQWAIGQADSGPTRVTPKMVKHPVPLDSDGMPTDPSQYNTATNFLVECEFPGGLLLEIRSDGRNGILIQGDQGRLFVNRGGISGKPIEDLETNPLPADAMKKAYGDMTPGGNNAHMRNFFDCVEARRQPISDVYTHHRAMTTCHLANIAIRLNRELKWDPEAQQIVDDPQAAAMQSRTQRAGYEISV